MNRTNYGNKVMIKLSVSLDGIDQDEQIWLSEEGNKHSPARLIKTGFSSSK
jgi:hypothetical protein